MIHTDSRTALWGFTSQVDALSQWGCVGGPIDFERPHDSWRADSATLCLAKSGRVVRPQIRGWQPGLRATVLQRAYPSGNMAAML